MDQAESEIKLNQNTTNGFFVFGKRGKPEHLRLDLTEHSRELISQPTHIVPRPGIKHWPV